MLITVDVGHTLGRFTGMQSVDVLAELAQQHHGAKESMVAEISRWFLHVAPTVTEDLIAEVCDYLLIPRAAWPDTWDSGFDPFPYTAEALADLSAQADAVVALSNVSVLTGPSRMAAVEAQLGPWLDQIVPSYTIATRKPHRRCWQQIARWHGVELGDIVHIGDRIPEDIGGALHAGCRGAILTNTRYIDIPTHLRTNPRVAVVDDLRAAIPALHAWHHQT